MTARSPASQPTPFYSRLGIAGFAALLFAVPLLLGAKEMRFIPVATALGALTLAIAGVLGSIHSGRSRPIRLTIWAGAGALVIGAASAFFREDLPLDRTYALDRFALLVAALTAWLGGSALLATGFGRDAKRALRVLLTAAFVMHLVAGIALWTSGQQVRMAGLVVQPNFFATLSTALILPELFARAKGARRSRRDLWLSLILVVALVVLLIASGSRAALLLGGTFVLIGIVGLRGRLIRSLAIAGIVLVALVLIVPNPLRDRVERDVDRSFPRSFIWEQAARIALENPLGIGLRMHEYYFAQRAFMPEEPSLSHRRHEIGIAHNVVLGASAEAGWLGGAGVLILIGSIIWLGRRRDRMANPRARGAWAGSLLLILHAQVDGVVQSPAALGGLVAILAFAQAQLGHRVVRRTRHASGATPKAVLACALVLASFWPSLQSQRASMELRRGNEALVRGDPETARAAFRNSLSIVPGNPGGWLGLAAIARREFEVNGDPSALLEIDRCCEALARANRFDTRGDRMAAELRRTQHFTEDRRDAALLLAAIRRLDRVLVSDPLDVASRFMRARLLVLVGRSDAASTDLVEVLRLEPSHPLAYMTLGELALAAGRKQEAQQYFESAMRAYFSAQGILSTGRYGPLPDLAEVVIGFRPVDCQRKILEAARP